MPQKVTANLTFEFNGVNIEQVNEFNFLGLLIDCNLNWKAHLHYGQYQDIESNWSLKETKIYISILHSTYHIQFSYFAPHQLFIPDMGNKMSENRPAAKESSQSCTFQVSDCTYKSSF